MQNGYGTVKKPHHHHHHSSHRNHKNHQQQNVRNQQQQTQTNSREYASQTTPTLFLGENPDDIPRSTPAFLRESSSIESLDEESLNDDANPLRVASPKQPSPVPPPKPSSTKVVVKKVLSPNVNKQQPSLPANSVSSSTLTVPQKVATPRLNPWSNANGWPVFDRDRPTQIPNMVRNE